MISKHLKLKNDGAEGSMVNGGNLYNLHVQERIN